MFQRDGNFMLVKITFISRVFEISFGIDKYEKNILLWGEIIIENLENLYKRAIEHIISIEFIIWERNPRLPRVIMIVLRRMYLENHLITYVM